MELGFSAQEFGRLSPAEFLAYMRAWNSKQDREDHRFASVEAIMAEINRDANKRPQPFQPSDFYRPRNAPKRTEPEVPAWKNQLAMVEALNAAFGGRDLRGDREGPLNEDHS